VSGQGGRGERTPPRHELAHVAGERLGQLERRVAEPQCDASLLDLQVVDVRRATRLRGWAKSTTSAPATRSAGIDADIVRRKAGTPPLPLRSEVWAPPE
jgi:hypothetical protein